LLVLAFAHHFLDAAANVIRLFFTSAGLRHWSMVLVGELLIASSDDVVVGVEPLGPSNAHLGIDQIAACPDLFAVRPITTRP
jgi:hypothetical protein